MDYCLTYKNPFSSSLLRSSLPPKPKAFHTLSFNFAGGSCNSRGRARRSPHRKGFLVLAASSTGSECGEYRGLNTPLQPRTPAGRLLGSVLLNDPQYFPQVVQKQLEQLVVDRYEALARMNLSSASDEACLHSCWIAQTPWEWHGRGKVQHGLENGVPVLPSDSMWPSQKILFSARQCMDLEQALVFLVVPALFELHPAI